MGRSMGSGPATYLASINTNIGGLILISPFTSLKDAVRTLLGKLPALIVKDRFVNKQAILKVKCPILFIHGQADTLIPCNHSQQLFSLCSSASTKLVMPQAMTHNTFGDLYTDLLTPIKDFLVHNNLHPSQTVSTIKEVPRAYLITPETLMKT